MNRIPIRISEKATKALAVLARQEYRDTQSQAALIIRDELIRRGLLSKEQPTELNPSNEEPLEVDQP